MDEQEILMARKGVLDQRPLLLLVLQMALGMELVVQVGLEVMVETPFKMEQPILALVVVEQAGLAMVEMVALLPTVVLVVSEHCQVVRVVQQYK